MIKKGNLLSSKNGKINLTLIVSALIIFSLYAIFSFGDLGLSAVYPVNNSNATLLFGVPSLTFNGTNAAFNCTVTLNGTNMNLSNVSLFISKNQSGTRETAVKNSTQWTNQTGPTSVSVIFNVSSPFDEGRYYWFCEGMQNGTSAEAHLLQFNYTTLNRTFTIDTTAPAFTVDTLSNSTTDSLVASGEKITIGINVSDSLMAITNVRLFANISGASENQINISMVVLNNTAVNFTYTIPANQVGHVLNFTFKSNDSLSNQRISSTVLFEVAQDGTAPGPIILNSPEDLFNTSSTTPTFSFTATDNNDTELTCDINITNTNTTYNQSITGLNVTSGVAHVNSSTALSSGVYRWSVNCTDGPGNINTSLARTFIVDTQTPSFLVATLSNSTSDSQVVPGETLVLGINVTDLLTGISSVRLFANVSGATDNEVNITRTVSNNSAANLSYVIPVGTINGVVFNLTFEVNDTAGNKLMSSIMIFNVSYSVAPTITVNTPTPVNQSVSGFIPNITVSTDATSCAYKLNITDSTKTNATPTSNYSIGTLSGGVCTWESLNFKNGVYNFTFNATDASDNTRVSNNTVNISDTTAPSIPNESAVTTGGITISTATVTITGMNETVNATVNFGTSINALTFVPGMETDFSSKQIVTLSSLSTATAYYFNVSVCDYNGNCARFGTFNFTTSSAASSSSSSSSSSGGGGAVTTTSNVAASSGRSWDSLAADVETKLSINSNSIAVTDILLIPKSLLTGAGLTVDGLKARPSSISTDATAKTYQYLEIKKSNFVDSDMSSIKIKFRVPKSWLTSNGVSEASIALYRYNGVWTKLATTMTGGRASDSAYYYYEATSPGFSTFAIGSDGTTSAETPTTDTATPTETPTTDTATTDTTQAETGKSGGKMWLILGIIVIVLALGLYMMQARRKQQPPMHHYK